MSKISRKNSLTCDAGVQTTHAVAELKVDMEFHNAEVAIAQKALNDAATARNRFEVRQKTEKAVAESKELSSILSGQLHTISAYIDSILLAPQTLNGVLTGTASEGTYRIQCTDFTGRKWDFGFRSDALQIKGAVGCTPATAEMNSAKEHLNSIAQKLLNVFMLETLRKEKADLEAKQVKVNKEISELENYLKES